MDTQLSVSFGILTGGLIPSRLRVAASQGQDFLILLHGALIVERTTDEVLSPSPPSVHLVWDDNEPVDQTPPPDHEEFERLAEQGRRATKERRERRRRNP